MPGMNSKLCKTCGDPFQSKRRDAKYCQNKCKQKPYNDKAAIKHRDWQIRNGYVPKTYKRRDNIDYLLLNSQKNTNNWQQESKNHPEEVIKSFGGIINPSEDVINPPEEVINPYSKVINQQRGVINSSMQERNIQGKLIETQKEIRILQQFNMCLQEKIQKLIKANAQFEKRLSRMELDLTNLEKKNILGR